MVEKKSFGGKSNMGLLDSRGSDHLLPTLPANSTPSLSLSLPLSLSLSLHAHSFVGGEHRETQEVTSHKLWRMENAIQKGKL